MKTFKRHRTLKELKAVCKKLGWKLDTTRFDHEGSDHVTIIWQTGRMTGRTMFSTVNGRFFGKLKDGRFYSSDEAKHDKKPWFRALLNAVYV
ncbi:hypothetical protein OPIT5_08175 [Opitutaceae bacterium TAV5]|nr:hypothetical protein OPIT5_08175 [Opitutaceae bacterium TAV5]